MFFKPDSDPRSSGDFAKDNFDFCMKTVIDKFMAFFMAPINAMMSKHTNLMGSVLGFVDIIRNIAQKLYNTLLGFLDQYMRRFNASVYEISRITQYLRMAMRRANGVMMSMLYTGLTMFRGMLNTIQFVIKVVLIIVGIMLAIIIILIFVLFPFIPLILSVLAAVVGTVLSLSFLMSGDLAVQANNDKGGFCFAENTLVSLNNQEPKRVSEIKIGDELGKGCGKITAIIKMDGSQIPLYNLNGIFVSGSHLVLGTDGIWKSVASDERAKLTDESSHILYCFNTTTHNIPVCSTSSDIILFRDWEELEEDDKVGQFSWNYLILKTLNNCSNYSKWKNGITHTTEIPIMGKEVLVKTKAGFVEISKLVMGIDKVLDKNGVEQNILGIINGVIDNCKSNDNKWIAELYMLEEGAWVKGQSTLKEGDNSVEGITIITESGEFIIWNEDEGEGNETIVRDFTDIGYTSIHKTYPLVASRLRLIATC